MLNRREKPLEEKCAEKLDEIKAELKRRKTARFLTAAQRRKVEELRKRVNEANRDGVFLKDVEIRRLVQL